MHAQYPSISTQDRTPKNNEESTFLLTLGQNKKEEPWRSVETSEEVREKKEIKGIRGTEGSCKIRQIKEELLNQGRREKEEESGKREMPYSTGTIETTATITQ